MECIDNHLLYTIKTRRSIRKYTDEPLPENALRHILLAGMYSPSSRNRRPWEFILVNDPDILLADEPTGNLDPKNSLEIMKLLEEINERGTTVLVVTHNQEIVNEMKKRVVTMKKGVIVSDEKKGGYNNEN